MKFEYKKFDYFIYQKKKREKKQDLVQSILQNTKPKHTQKHQEYNYYNSRIGKILGLSV